MMKLCLLTATGLSPASFVPEGVCEAAGLASDRLSAHAGVMTAALVDCNENVPGTCQSGNLDVPLFGAF